MLAGETPVRAARIKACLSPSSPQSGKWRSCAIRTNGELAGVLEKFCLVAPGKPGLLPYRRRRAR